jgi:uncharacterized protein YndB with AHSA1/START domain
MAVPVEIEPANERELVIARQLDASAEAPYRCWTDPALLPLWFAPRPLTTEVLEMDVRPGGRQRLVMRDPGGGEYPTGGVYLALEPGRRVVFTDAFEQAWIPSEKPMMAAEITFQDLGGGQTLYVARARHWTLEAAKAHAEMGFHAGWGMCAAQLEEVARGVPGGF